MGAAAVALLALCPTASGQPGDAPPPVTTADLAWMPDAEVAHLNHRDALRWVVRVNRDDRPVDAEWRAAGRALSAWRDLAFAHGHAHGRAPDPKLAVAHLENLRRVLGVEDYYAGRLPVPPIAVETPCRN